MQGAGILTLMASFIDAMQARHHHSQTRANCVLSMTNLDEGLDLGALLDALLALEGDVDRG
jgi:hypothetical protein